MRSVLQHMLAPASLQGIHIFSQTPGTKTPPQTALDSTGFCRPTGQQTVARRLHSLRYDWQPYAEQMLEVLSGEPLLANTAADYAPQPAYRPLTKFENRGLRLGHGVWDLVFVRRL